MSEANQQAEQPKLTTAQKEAARQLGMSEKDYAKEAAKGIKSGRLNPANIP